MAKRIITPWAENGDKDSIPETPVGLLANWQSGYPSSYEEDPGTPESPNPNARFVERDVTNQLFNDITGNIKGWQDRAYPDFITADSNDGVPFPYQKFTKVYLDGVLYESLIDGNASVPPASGWAVFSRSASLTENDNGGSVQDYIDLNVTALDSTLDIPSLSGVVSGGERVNWMGYYEASDGGSNWGTVYKGAHTADGGSIFSIDSDTYIKANLKGNSINVRKFGAKADALYFNEADESWYADELFTTPCTNNKAAFDKLISMFDVVDIGVGSYGVTFLDTITEDNKTIQGYGRSSQIVNISPMNNPSVQGASTIVVAADGFTIKDLNLIGNQKDDGTGQDLIGTGHNIRFVGDNVTQSRYKGDVANVHIYNGYNGITVENLASEITISDCRTFNCHHGYQVFRANSVKIDNCSAGITPFLSSNGWTKRNLTIHTSSKNVQVSNCTLRDADITNIYVRFQFGDNTSNLENIQLNNISVIGNENSYSGLYIENENTTGKISNLNFTSLNFSDFSLSNAILYSGVLDANGVDGTAVEDSIFSNITFKNCLNGFQIGKADAQNHNVGWNNCTFSNMTGSDSIKLPLGLGCVVDNVQGNSDTEVPTNTTKIDYNTGFTPRRSNAIMAGTDTDLPIGVSTAIFRIYRGQSGTSTSHNSLFSGLLEFTSIVYKTSSVHAKTYHRIPVIIQGRSSEVLTGATGVDDVTSIISSDTMTVEFVNATSLSIDLAVTLSDAAAEGGVNFIASLDGQTTADVSGRLLYAENA